MKPRTHSYPTTERQKIAVRKFRESPNNKTHNQVGLSKLRAKVKILDLKEKKQIGSIGKLKQ